MEHQQILHCQFLDPMEHREWERATCDKACVSGRPTSSPMRPPRLAAPCVVLRRGQWAWMPTLLPYPLQALLGSRSTSELELQRRCPGSPRTRPPLLAMPRALLPRPLRALSGPAPPRGRPPLSSGSNAAGPRSADSSSPGSVELICIRGKRECNFASPLSSDAVCIPDMAHLLDKMHRMNSSNRKGKNAFASYVGLSLRASTLVSYDRTSHTFIHKLGSSQQTTYTMGCLVDLYKSLICAYKKGIF
jgi:hypothetical protein